MIGPFICRVLFLDMSLQHLRGVIISPKPLPTSVKTGLETQGPTKGLDHTTQREEALALLPSLGGGFPKRDGCSVRDSGSIDHCPPSVGVRARLKWVGVPSLREKNLST
jgi:hypothetical protein